MRRRLAARMVAGAALAGALTNAAASLAYAPQAPVRAAGTSIEASRLHPLVATGPWSLGVAAVLLAVAAGARRRRREAWLLGLALLGVLTVLDVLHERPALTVAAPVAGAWSLVAMRRMLVAEPYRRLLRSFMLPTPEALACTEALVRAHGCDAMAPFKLRTDVGHLFAPARDAVLAFRVENGALLVSGDPVGTASGERAVLELARDLAGHAGLSFGVTTASVRMADLLRDEFGMLPIYMGCEAVVPTAGFSLQGGRIKKVRQAHRRVQSAGFALVRCRGAALTGAQRAALRELYAATRAGEEQSFAMAPESIEAPGLEDAEFVMAQHAASGEIAGVMVFVPLAGRSMWSLALQLRDPASPNGVIDALVVHALQEAQAEGVEAISLNFAAARRYLHEKVRGFWPHVARLLARLATRWTQIDDLRAHNEKFSPTWEQRFLVVDHRLDLPRLAFATIWQEGQLPRPDAFLRPAWPCAAPTA